MSGVPSIELNNGVGIPQFGFGVFQIERSRTFEAAQTAFEAGYRHTDAAQMYGNEAEVGQTVEESGLPRDEVFITTKLHNDRHGYDSAISALDESLERLRTDHVDLYLIHYPMPATWRLLQRRPPGSAEYRERQTLSSMPLDGRVVALVAAVGACGESFVTMHSGAAHDTMSVADMVPSAMVFVPCRDGISHSPEEEADAADAALAAEIMLNSIGSLSEGR